ncbi:cell division cycle protein 123 homolog, partial [Choloepus didactylus]|uniref:cell division cycle protein 123 homolog n=1 Tax=Choloepus didactylus TaxID=27675 RepID=UPI0018A06FF0
FDDFRSLTIKSVILPLPENVKDYLLDDGTLVVSGREDPPARSQPDSDDDTEEIQAPEFPEFTTKVQEAINSPGGSVFPKLNWSAPRDAYWIAMNSSLKCKTLSDIFLLFKSSDFITRDFTQPFIHCTDDSPDPCMEYELVLRKWCELIPGAEFRCFVKENKLIGISQRDYTQYYDHISKQKEEICRCIQDFFKKHIQYKFLDEDFVFDIYRDSRDDSIVSTIKLRYLLSVRRRGHALRFGNEEGCYLAKFQPCGNKLWKKNGKPAGCNE